MPAFDKDEPGRIPKHDGTTTDRPPSVMQIWALEPGGTDQPGVLWAGTIPGGLFKSEDDGQSWKLVRSLWDKPERMQWMGGGADWPGIHSVCVDPRDSKHVSVAISCGGMWSTFDGGETWECRAHGMRADYMPPDRKYDPNVQDPHRVVHCPANPDAMWAQHHNGIFRTTNGGQQWSAVEPGVASDFGFAVAVHPAHGDTAWFVPATSDEVRVPREGKVLVTRTRDGGKSFDVLRHGLPQSHAYDIVYRHALDIDSSGDRLAFGSTTGGFWMTQNGGDTWQDAGTRLPPIYCVRFG